MINFYCTYCGQPIEAGEELASSNSFCPSCGKEIKVPPIQQDRGQPPVSEPPESTIDVNASETPREASLPATQKEADTGLGGTILSLVGSGVLILVVVFFSRQCGGFIGKKAAERELAERAAQTDYSSSQSSTQSSIQDRLDEFNLVGLTISLPGRPNERTIPLPDSVKATLRSKDSYLYQNGTQTISVSSDVFVEEFDFSSRCNLVFEQLKKVDSNADQEQFSIDEVSGMCFRFNAGDGTYCALLVFSRETTVWQVQVLDVVSRADSTKALSETIFSSIQITP